MLDAIADFWKPAKKQSQQIFGNKNPVIAINLPLDVLERLFDDITKLKFSLMIREKNLL